jgi:hypothetical protein
VSGSPTLGVKAPVGKTGKATKVAGSFCRFLVGGGAQMAPYLDTWVRTRLAARTPTPCPRGWAERVDDCHIQGNRVDHGRRRAGRVEDPWDVEAQVWVAVGMGLA